ncbi:aerobic glycerol-3-phosphate dehydrogenase [Halalkalibacter akibai JCM 9157]|uniref:Aerobic glycerol-3-phosphate dehydrogenase n=1 Tax=Halalkalibacter akibai (strain ATCC 43226 / DSM 21942 / CIP 109018 / JCM 9157 / 1139) TaxID=1236973 RepID=W4QVV0_HALA3|nr:aerobic glycerol-3-phosphate dehydrogenase [Halalkalibacter akibai JCM 9157]
MLNKTNVLKKEPLIREDRLKGGGIYVEYRTDDARLTLEVLKEAVNRGAVATNYAKAEGFIYVSGKVVGVKVKDILSGKMYEVYAKKIVNAAGPWVDTLREQDGSKQGKYLHLTKGVHLVVDQSRFPLKQAVYFDTEKDGRMVFAIPRDGKTYVGTTDTFYNDDLVHPRMTEKDRDYIIKAVNFMFPTVKLTAEDIESSWTGLRPLIHEEGKSASEISRKDEIFLSESGLISIAGGKLTGYRKMAERIVDFVAKELGNNQRCTTDRITLSGGDVGGSAKFQKFVNRKTKEGMKLGLTEKEAKRVVNLYGGNIDKIYSLLRSNEAESKEHQLPALLLAQLQYGMAEEMVVTPTDFFNRRTGAIFFNIDWVSEWKEAVVAYMAKTCHWSGEEKERYKVDLDTELYYARNPLNEKDSQTKIG